VFAVGAHDGLGKADRLVAACPVECRFEHNLFCWIALRFVEAGGKLGLAEDVGDAVIADAVAGSEVVVRVVVEGAPSDAARVLRIRRDLVVNARMAQRVLAQPLDVVGGLCRESVADEFGVEITRMVRWSKRESEIVHREDIFEKLGIVPVPDAAGLARGIELVRDGVGARVEVVIVLRFVDAYTPENDRWMIPVAADHASNIVDRELLPGFVADVLPSRNLFKHEQAELVAGVEEMA